MEEEEIEEEEEPFFPPQAPIPYTQRYILPFTQASVVQSEVERAQTILNEFPDIPTNVFFIQGPAVHRPQDVRIRIGVDCYLILYDNQRVGEEDDYNDHFYALIKELVNNGFLKLTLSFYLQQGHILREINTIFRNDDWMVDAFDENTFDLIQDEAERLHIPVADYQIVLMRWIIFKEYLYDYPDFFHPNFHL